MEGIHIVDNFEGSSIGNTSWDRAALRVGLKREPVCTADGRTHDYNLHFIFGLRSELPQPVTFQVEVEPQNSKSILYETNLFVGSDVGEDLQFYPKQAKTDQFRFFTFTVKLQPGEQKVISNTLMRPYAYLLRRFSELSESSQAAIKIIGHSVEKRPIYAYSWQGHQWESKGPTLFITSGLHPTEPDTLATENIMEHLTTSKGKEMLKGLRLVMVPISNPDGFVHGYNGCNTSGINYFWDFKYQDAQNCPEASALWTFINEICPWVYLDFHCYTIQGNRKHAGPYIKPIWFYQGSKWKQLSRDIYDALNEIPETQSRIMFAPSSLSQLIVERFNTISIAKYHLHLQHGPQACRDLGLEVTERIISSIRKYVQGGGRSHLIYPCGSIQKSFLLAMLRRMKIDRHYWERYVPGRN